MARGFLNQGSTQWGDMGWPTLDPQHPTTMLMNVLSLERATRPVSGFFSPRLHGIHGCVWNWAVPLNGHLMRKIMIVRWNWGWISVFQPDPCYSSSSLPILLDILLVNLAAFLRCSPKKCIPQHFKASALFQAVPPCPPIWAVWFPMGICQTFLAWSAVRIVTIIRLIRS